MNRIPRSEIAAGCSPGSARWSSRPSLAGASGLSRGLSGGLTRSGASPVSLRGESCVLRRWAGVSLGLRGPVELVVVWWRPRRGDGERFDGQAHQPGGRGPTTPASPPLPPPAQSWCACPGPRPSASRRRWQSARRPSRPHNSASNSSIDSPGPTELGSSEAAHLCLERCPPRAHSRRPASLRGGLRPRRRLGARRLPEPLLRSEPTGQEVDPRLGVEVRLHRPAGASDPGAARRAGPGQVWREATPGARRAPARAEPSLDWTASRLPARARCHGRRPLLVGRPAPGAGLGARPVGSTTRALCGRGWCAPAAAGAEAEEGQGAGRVGASAPTARCRLPVVRPTPRALRPRRGTRPSWRLASPGGVAAGLR